MSKTVTNEEFIKRCEEKHGGRFDHSMVEYTDSKTKIKVICNECGHISERFPQNHLKSKCCKVCKSESERMNLESFMEKSIKIYGEKFDYSKVDFKGRTHSVELICNDCGKESLRKPTRHLTKYYECKHCLHDSLRMTRDEFLRRSKVIHGDKFDYSMVEYTRNSTPVFIKCNDCGDICNIAPANHLSGRSCPRCSKKKVPTNEEFIKRCSKKHKDRYDYSKVSYKNCKTKVEIICKKCDQSFMQTPSKHLFGRGCPHCNLSIGENRIIDFLDENEVSYETQKTFKDCVNVGRLKFDFYIEGLGCIEFNGKQHYQPVEFFGGVEEFLKNITRDSIKRSYCCTRGIPLHVIKYNEDVEERMSKIIKGYN